ncbi:MAG: SDR family NAD(P)-dependent oxidoreductase, partial [Rhabdochlamydiaceae bacterium]
DVCAASRSLADIQDLVSEIKTRYKVNAIGTAADISKNSSAARAVRRAVQGLGGLDGLVCRAGYPLLQTVWNKELTNLTRKFSLKYSM